MYVCMGLQFKTKTFTLRSRNQCKTKIGDIGLQPISRVYILHLQEEYN